jgi:ribosomal protein S27AE
MAEKYALYLPYKVLDSLSSGNVTDTEFREFITGLAGYADERTEPAFKDRALTMLFESIRADIDFNRAKYEATVEKRREAGKQGGAPEGNTNAVGNRGGGAPLGNTNAAKKNTPDQFPEPENKHKHLIEFEPEKQTQAESESVVGNQYLGFSSSSGVVSQLPLTTTTAFIILCKTLGYSLDRQTARKVTADLDPAWLSGAFTYPEFIAGIILKNYAEKPLEEKRKLFRKLILDAEERKDEYPQWRESEIAGAAKQEKQRRQEAADDEKRRKLDEARADKPKICGNCGKPLAPESDRGNCPSCGYEFSFDEKSCAYRFSEQRSLSDEFKKLREAV